jgi:hypothetical protein
MGPFYILNQLTLILGPKRLIHLFWSLEVQAT